MPYNITLPHKLILPLFKRGKTLVNCVAIIIISVKIILLIL